MELLQTRSCLRPRNVSHHRCLDVVTISSSYVDDIVLVTTTIVRSIPAIGEAPIGGEVPLVVRERADRNH